MRHRRKGLLSEPAEDEPFLGHALLHFRLPYGNCADISCSANAVVIGQGVLWHIVALGRKFPDVKVDRGVVQ